MSKNRTALYGRHKDLGAKFIAFAGWDMPVQYQGIIQEHLAVRERVGVFDVSHMGRIEIKGSGAESFLDYLSTNIVKGKADGSATYTVWCHPNGTCVDDLIVYRADKENFFIIVNASNREKDLEHLKKEAEGFNVKIIPKYNEEGILAVQGPLATTVIENIFPEASSIEPMHFKVIDGVILSKTGYTGAGGFEIYAKNERIVELWDALFESKKIVPVGLGARDTLRLEMGFALYGHELSDEILATESISRWTVKLKKPKFLGKEALEASQSTRRACGVMLQEKGIAREGDVVFSKDQEIGMVTSGTFSPCLNCGIALSLTHTALKEGDEILIQVRKRKIPARVVKLPFYRR